MQAIIGLVQVLISIPHPLAALEGPGLGHDG